MNSPWHEIRWEVGRRRGVSRTPSLQRLQLRGDIGLEERQALVEDPEFPAEFGKSVGPPWKKAGDTVIQVRSSRKFQGHRKSQGVLVCQAQGEDPWDRGRESPGAGPAGVTQENEEAEMVEKGRAVI